MPSQDEEKKNNRLAGVYNGTSFETSISSKSADAKTFYGCYVHVTR